MNILKNLFCSSIQKELENTKRKLELVTSNYNTFIVAVTQNRDLSSQRNVETLIDAATEQVDRTSLSIYDFKSCIHLQVETLLYQNSLKNPVQKELQRQIQLLTMMMQMAKKINMSFFDDDNAYDIYTTFDGDVDKWLFNLNMVVGE